MPSTQRLKIELGRIIRFGVTGAVSALSYAAITYAIVEAGFANPMVATAVGFCVAATISYLGHLYYSFGVKPDHRAFFWRFAITVGVTFAMTEACTWLITGYWSYSFRVAIVVVTVLIPATNYLCSRFWVFMPGLKA